MKNFKNLLYSYIFYSISAFGISLSIKANVGVSSFNSMNLAISEVMNIKVGTITIIINTLFLITYMYMTKFSKKNKYMLQMFSVVIFGSLINFFTYFILKDFIVTNYTLRILLIIIATIISGTSVGMIINYGKITFPIESFCLALSDLEISREKVSHKSKKISTSNAYVNKKSISFAKARYSIDVFSIITSLIISLAFSLPFYVREGTIISLILFTGSINFSKSIYANNRQ